MKVKVISYNRNKTICNGRFNYKDVIKVEGKLIKVIWRCKCGKQLK